MARHGGYGSDDGRFCYAAVYTVYLYLIDIFSLQVVKQMPTIVRSKQPTIAIITAQYCEKIAVDSIMDNKETFVRYTTVGALNLSSLSSLIETILNLHYVFPCYIDSTHVDWP